MLYAREEGRLLGKIQQRLDSQANASFNNTVKRSSSGKTGCGTNSKPRNMARRSRTRFDPPLERRRIACHAKWEKPATSPVDFGRDAPHHPALVARQRERRKIVVVKLQHICPRFIHGIHSTTAKQAPRKTTFEYRGLPKRRTTPTKPYDYVIIVCLYIAASV